VAVLRHLNTFTQVPLRSFRLYVMALSLTDIERRFRVLKPLVKGAVSARHRMFLMDDFLGNIAPDYRKYRSYVIEMGAELPLFSHPVSYTGINPALVEQILRRFGELMHSVPELRTYPGFEDYGRRLHQLLVMLLWFAGDTTKMVHYLRVGSGIEPTPSEFDDPTRSRPPHTDISQAPDNKEIIRLTSTLEREGFQGLLRALHQHEGCQPKGHLFLEGLEQDLLQIKKLAEASVLIPVSETHSYDGETVSYGRLRRLYCTVRRDQGQAEADHFRRLFNIAGVEDTHWPPDDEVIGAYRSMLQRHAPELTGMRFGGELTYEMNIQLHEGRSSNAAVAVLLASGAQRAGDARRQFTVVPEVCITGEIDAEGKMLPVSIDSVREKAEAFFFSWAEALVVPMAQEQLFRAILEGLAGDYPNRRYVLSGLNRVDDVYYDRRLTVLEELNPAMKLARKAWKRKFEAFGTTVIIALLFIIGSLLYGPIDRNPVRGEIVGDYLELYNKYSQQLTRIHLGNDFKQHFSYPYITGSFFHLTDITGDGFNELFYYKQDVPVTSIIPELIAWSISGDSLIWSQKLSYNMSFPNRFGEYGKFFFGYQITSTTDENGHHVLITVLNEYRYFPSLLQKIDVQTGNVLSYYYHAGHIRSLSLMDLDGDGISEVLIGGVNNSEDAAFFAIIDMNSISGHSHLTDLYYVEGFARANERAYLLMPPTSMIKLAERNTSYNSLVQILPSDYDSTIKVVLMDTFFTRGSSSFYSFLSVDMDSNLNVLGVYTHDQWDIMVNDFYQNGLIEALPDAQYFREYAQTFRRVR
jgi:hypothetical protein